jgi:hypothetical protein
MCPSPDAAVNNERAFLEEQEARERARQLGPRVPQELRRPAPEGTVEWVLLQKAQIDGEVKDPGYRFFRPEDWDGVPKAAERDGLGFRDVPIAMKASDLPRPAPSDGPAPGENVPADPVYERQPAEDVTPLPAHEPTPEAAHDIAADPAPEHEPPAIPPNPGEPSLDKTG